MSFDFVGPYLPTFIKSTLTTIEISFIALFFGFIIGLILCLAKMSKNGIFKALSTIYIEVIRDTPLLVQLSIIYYGLPQVGINFPSLFGIPSDFIAGAFALSINSGAYVAEIMRSGIQSVDKGQMEASRSLGLSYWATMRHVIVPQAVKKAEIMRSGIQSVDKGQMEASRSLGLSYWATMRHVIVPQAVKNILPSLANEFVSLVKESAILSFIGVIDIMFTANTVKNATNEFVSLVKESAILSFIGVIDIMFTANTVKNATYDSFGPYLFAAAIYFVLTFTLSKLVGLLEKKMAASN